MATLSELVAVAVHDVAAGRSRKATRVPVVGGGPICILIAASER